MINNSNFLTVSFKLNGAYVDAFWSEWANNDDLQEEIILVSLRGVWGMRFPKDADETVCEQEVVEFLARYGWHLGTHYEICK